MYEPGKADIERRWWKLEDVYKKHGRQKPSELDVVNCLFSEVDRVDEENQERQQRILDAGALYGDLNSFEGSALTTRLFYFDDRVTHNVIASAVDSLVAEVTQSTVRPMCISEGGDPEDRAKARLLTKYLDAKWDKCNAHELIRTCVRDAVVMGIGCAYVAHKDPDLGLLDQTYLERIFPGNVLMDDKSSVDTMPRQFYVRRFVPRAHLADLFPEYAEEIRQAKNYAPVFYQFPDKMDNWVEVIHAVHLPSRPGKKDGKIVLALRNKILTERELATEEIPYKLIRGVAPLMGWWGDFLVLRAAPAQVELNELLEKVSEALDLIATPRVFVNRQAGIVESHMTNEIGVLIEYDGQPPIFHTPQAIHAEMYAHIERLEQWVYKEMGVSELSATSQKPAGLDSGAALRTYNDIQTRRWINFVRSYEKFCEELALEFVRQEKLIADKHPKSRYVTLAHGQRYEKKLWKDIEIPEDRFSVRMYSSSALPTTPAGKIQALSELVKTGVIDQKMFLRLADVPDFDSVRRMVTAPDELIEMRCQKMLEDEKYHAEPEPGIPYADQRRIATLMAWQAEIDELPEERIEKLFQYLEKIDKQEQLIQEKAMQAQMQQQMAMMPPAPTTGGPPGAPPGAPPMGPPPGPMPMMPGPPPGMPNQG